MTGPLIIAAIGMVIGALALSAATWRSAAAYIACLILVAFGLLYESGRPRPMWAEVSHSTNPVLVAAQLDEPHAIYLWLLWDSTPPPIAYRLPWSEETAAQLVKTEKQAKQEHTQVMVVRKGLAKGPHMDGKRMFYPQPQRALPPKAPR